MIFLIALCLLVFMMLANGMMAIAVLICGSILAKRKLRGKRSFIEEGESDGQPGLSKEFSNRN